MSTRPQRAFVAAAALLFFASVFSPSIRAASPLNPPATHSASGQFIISVQPDDSPFYRRPGIGTNAALMRLQPPWLAVSAERFKSALWRELGVSASAPWSGKIFLVLRPARSLDESVAIIPQPFINTWNCRVDLPDIIQRDRYARAVTAAVLLEYANRSAATDGHSAELPPWLVDGLARQVVESEEIQAILSAPTKQIGGVPQMRTEENQRGLDPLAEARRVLQGTPALTFDQLSWPSPAQMRGDDDRIYFASSQLFVNALLDLKNGPEKFRALLAALPACANWQAAFYRAFRGNFRSPLDVEKWWALRVVAFASRSPGPRWTAAVSRQKLDSLLAVPVGVRYASNSLPVRAEVSLQSVIQNFSGEERDQIIRARLRDLEIARLRLVTPLAALADGYCAALADFLGESKAKPDRLMLNKHVSSRKGRISAASTTKKLDALDARRRQVESQLEQRALPVRTP